MSGKTYRAKRSLTIDLDYDSAFPVTAGATYTDDGTTVFNDYVCDELFEAASPDAGTIVVSHPEARRSRKN
jgi:hypothetical protein